MNKKREIEFYEAKTARFFVKKTHFERKKRRSTVMRVHCGNACSIFLANLCDVRVRVRVRVNRKKAKEKIKEFWKCAKFTIHADQFSNQKQRRVPILNRGLRHQSQWRRQPVPSAVIFAVILQQQLLHFHFIRLFHCHFPIRPRRGRASRRHLAAAAGVGWAVLHALPVVALGAARIRVGVLVPLGQLAGTLLEDRRGRAAASIDHGGV